MAYEIHFSQISPRRAGVSKAGLNPIQDGETSFPRNNFLTHIKGHKFRGPEGYGGGNVKNIESTASIPGCIKSGKLLGMPIYLGKIVSGTMQNSRGQIRVEGLQRSLQIGFAHLTPLRAGTKCRSHFYLVQMCYGQRRGSLFYQSNSFIASRLFHVNLEENACIKIAHQTRSCRKSPMMSRKGRGVARVFVRRLLKSGHCFELDADTSLAMERPRLLIVTRFPFFALRRGS